MHPHGTSDNPHTYSKEKARIIFRRAFLEGGSVVSPTHARGRMKDHDLDTNDLLQLARVGQVLNEPEQHIKTGNMTYRMEMADPPVKAVFTILGPNRVQLITVFVD